MRLFRFKKTDSKLKRAFSLLEMIVSLGLFSVGALIAIGGFLSVIGANKKAQTTKTAINNLNYTMEGILREMRVSSSYYCSDVAVYNYGDKVTDGIAYGSLEGQTNDAIISFVTNIKKNPGNSTEKNLAYVYKYTPPTDMDTGYISKAECNDGAITCNLNNDDYIRITPDTVNITSAQFKCGKVNQTLAAGYSNPQYAKVYLKGVAGDKIKEQTDFNLELLITPRI